MLSKGKKIYVTVGKGGKLQVAALGYLKDLKGEGSRVEDYLPSPSPGIWFNPTGLFGLRGRIKDGEFTNLFAGRHPHTGAALGPTVDLDRMGGMELVCSPPKDFSILWSAGNTEQRRVLRDAHDLAVVCVILFIQEYAARSRKGAGGQSGLVRAALIAALFNHQTSREADPQVHTHIAFVNLAILGNGKLRALEFKEFLEWRGAASAVYRVALAIQLTKLGVRIERKGRNFILPDVPRGLVAEQSQRRRLMEVFHADLVEFLRAQAGERPALVSEKFGKAIKKFLNEWRADGKPPLDWRNLTLDDDEDDTGYADAVALATRGRKPPVSQDELKAEWAAKRAMYGFAIDQVFGKAVPRQSATAKERAEIVRAAVAELIEASAVLEERDVIRIVAEHAQGKLGYEDVERALREAKASKDLIVLFDANDERLYTTVEAIERAHRIVESVKRRSREDQHEIAAEHYQAVVDSRPTMTDEQKEVLAHSAQGCGVGVIEGRDGAGKSLTMDVAREMHQRARYEVLGCAFSKKAADMLEKSSAIMSSTIYKLLSDLQKGIRRIGKKTCIVVDEARRVSSAHGEALLNAAESNGSKILLVGDTQQLLPIAICAQARRHTDATILDAVVRQRLDENDANPNWRRQVVIDLAAGRVPDAIRALAARGKFRLSDARDVAVQEISTQYRTLLRRGESVIAVARLRKDVKLLNASLREAYRQEGILGAEEIEINGSDGKIGVALGERLMTRKTDAKKGLVNGAIGVVTEIQPLQQEPGMARSGYAIGLRMEDSSTRVIETDTYLEKKRRVALTHAYAMTIFNSQRVTVDRTLAFGDRRWNRRDTYIGLSRHRLDVTVFTDRRIWKQEWRKRYPKHTGDISDEQLHERIGHAWSRNVEKAHVFDYLSERRVKEILDERRTVREAEVVAQARREAMRRVAATSFADLVPPLPPLKIDEELLEKLRQLQNYGTASRPTIGPADGGDAQTYQVDLGPVA